MMAKASSSGKSSSVFSKKSSPLSSHPNSLRLFHRSVRVLRRLRPILVKEPEVAQILDRLLPSADDSGLFRSDGRQSGGGSLKTTEERRTLSLLDRLERADEATVFAFVDAIRDRHRHLGSLLNTMIKNCNSDDDDDDENVADRTAMSGEALRKILKDSIVRRRPLPSDGRTSGGSDLHSDPSTEKLRENSSDENEDYLDCFVVSSRGRMQTERWIRYSDTRKTERQTKEEEEETAGRTFMASVMKDLVFRRINPQSLPVLVRRPPIHCRQVYVLDDDSKYSPSASKDSRRTDEWKGRSLKGHSSRSRSATGKESFQMREKDISCVLSSKTVNSVPPPLPPKPENLPQLLFLSSGAKGRWHSASSADPRDVLSSIESPMTQDSASSLPSSLPSSLLPTIPAKSSSQTDNQLKDDQLAAYSTKSSNSEEFRGTNADGSKLSGNEKDKQEMEEGDDLSLNFEVQVEDPEIQDNEEEEDPYEAVVHPDGDDDPSQEISEQIDPAAGDHLEAKSETADGGDASSNRDPLDANASPSSTGLSETVVVGQEATDSNAAFPGKLNARDSGVDSVVSQGFPDSPLGPEPGTDPEVFPVLSDVKMKGSEDDNASTDCSYYEDIELFSAGLQSPSLHFDPDSDRSIGRNFKLPFERFGGFAGTSPEQKVIPCGSLLLVETEEASSSSLDFRTDRADAGEEDPLMDYRGTVLGYDKEGFAYFVPRDALKRFGDPQDENWFYPIEITAHEATVFLNREKQTGCFVVYRPRNSAPTGAQFLLSVCRAEGDVVHYSIVENVHGDFKVKGHDHSFMTICELVSYFRRNQSHLATRLRRSLKDARMPITPGYHYPERLEIRKTEIQLDETMGGHGGRGVMCRGQLNGSSVTVKVLSRDSSSTEDDDFLEEAQTLMSLKHENIVRLIGLCCRSRPFYVITEYFDRGSLLECLHNNVIRSDSIEELFDVCLQVVAAMSYLEGLQFLIHRALAAKNFFVTHDMLVKLTNFERARIVDDDNYLACETEEISVRWAAPEVLLQSSYSTKSDVWAAGVVFWEIFSTGACPYAKLTDEETAVYVADGGRLERPGSCTSDLFLLMKSCWRPLASDRPSFGEIQEEFKGNSSVYYYSGQIHLPPVVNAGPPVAPRSNSTTVPQLPMKVKGGTNSAKQSLTPTPTTKTRHPSAPLRESRSTEGTLKVISENAKKDYGSMSGGGGGGVGGRGGGGGGGGDRLQVPGDAIGRHQSVVSSSGGERVQTSSSDSSSVVSASVSNDFDKDLSRGDKIRKSIRKLIIGKKTAK